MTTYGTIPTLPVAPRPPPSFSGRQVFSRAQEWIEAGLGTRRPWKEMFQPENMSLPADLAESFERIRSNGVVFRTNYAIILVFILLMSLLWQPVSLIVIVVVSVAWLFLYFLRDEKEGSLVVLGRAFDDGLVMTALLSSTIVALFRIIASESLALALSVGLVVITVHGVLRETGLSVDEEGLGFAGDQGCDFTKVPLRHAAASALPVS